MMRFIFSFLLCFVLHTALAQVLDPSLTLIAPDTAKITELNDIRDSLTTLDEEVKTKQQELNTITSKEDRLPLEQEIRDLEVEKKQYWQQFIELSTGVSITERQVPTDVSKRDLVKDLQELVAPMIDTLRRASERPRRIEHLKNEIFNLEQDLTPREDALKKTKELILDPRYAAFNTEIDQTGRLLEREIREIQIELSSKERQLKKELGEKRSFMDEAKGLFGSFMKTKGKNLFFFFLTFFVIFWIALWSRERIFRLKIWENERFEFLSQPLRGIYGFLAFLVALLGAVLCLYILHDWVLVTLFVILLAGVIWSLKHIFPRFIQEARLILNLGTVREGERIIWNGVSWKVIKLGFQSLVKNESLQGATMRIASKDLISLYSRPVVDHEPWFPTKVGDWILVEKDSLAQVVVQTMEQVVLEKVGGSRQVFTVQDFWKLKAVNLSSGFAIELLCGIDYKFQKEVTKEVEKNLQSYFLERFSSENSMMKISLEFHSAGLNALNFYSKLDCPGELASERLSLERKAQRVFVEACNHFGYEIPFNQVTVHMGK